MLKKSKKLLKLEKELIPTPYQTLKALNGSIGIPYSEQAAFVFESSESLSMFDRKQINDEDEWIPSIKEQAQSFAQFVESKPNLITEQKNTICIMALDKSIPREFVEKCKEFVEAFFFGIKVQILKSININSLKVRTRK